MKFNIGKGSSIHLGCRFNASGLFTMAECSTINQFCHIDNRGGIKIGRSVSVSPKTSLITADHDINDPEAIGRIGAIIIEDYVFIGYSAIILKDCILKKGSVVGAGSILTKSTEEYGIYYGMPAKLKSIRNKNISYNGNYKRLFH